MEENNKLSEFEVKLNQGEFQNLKRRYNEILESLGFDTEVSNPSVEQLLKVLDERIKNEKEIYKSIPRRESKERFVVLERITDLERDKKLIVRLHIAQTQLRINNQVGDESLVKKRIAEIKQEIKREKNNLKILEDRLQAVLEEKNGFEIKEQELLQKLTNKEKKFLNLSMMKKFKRFIPKLMNKNAAIFDFDFYSGGELENVKRFFEEDAQANQFFIEMNQKSKNKINKAQFVKICLLTAMWAGNRNRRALYEDENEEKKNSLLEEIEKRENDLEKIVNEERLFNEELDINKIEAGVSENIGLLAEFVFFDFRSEIGAQIREEQLFDRTMGVEYNVLAGGFNMEIERFQIPERYREFIESLDREEKAQGYFEFLLNAIMSADLGRFNRVVIYLYDNSVSREGEIRNLTINGDEIRARLENNSIEEERRIIEQRIEKSIFRYVVDDFEEDIGSGYFNLMETEQMEFAINRVDIIQEVGSSVERVRNNRYLADIINKMGILLQLRTTGYLGDDLDDCIKNKIENVSLYFNEFFNEDLDEEALIYSIWNEYIKRIQSKHNDAKRVIVEHLNEEYFYYDDEDLFEVNGSESFAFKDHVSNEKEVGLFVDKTKIFIKCFDTTEEVLYEEGLYYNAQMFYLTKNGLFEHVGEKKIRLQREDEFKIEFINKFRKMLSEDLKIETRFSEYYDPYFDKDETIYDERDLFLQVEEILVKTKKNVTKDDKDTLKRLKTKTFEWFENILLNNIERTTEIENIFVDKKRYDAVVYKSVFCKSLLPTEGLFGEKCTFIIDEEVYYKCKIEFLAHGNENEGYIKFFKNSALQLQNFVQRERLFENVIENFDSQREVDGTVYEKSKSRITYTCSVFYDFETVYDNVTNKIRPYSLSFIAVVDEKENKNYKVNDFQGVFFNGLEILKLGFLYDDESSENPQNLVERFLRETYYSKDFEDYSLKFTSFNGSRFDAFLLIEDLVAEDEVKEMNIVNNTIFSCKFRNRECELFDLCRMVSCSLEKSCEMFDIPIKFHKKQGIVDHLLVERHYFDKNSLKELFGQTRIEIASNKEEIKLYFQKMFNFENPMIKKESWLLEDGDFKVVLRENIQIEEEEDLEYYNFFDVFSMALVEQQFNEKIHQLLIESIKDEVKTIEKRKKLFDMMNKDAAKYYYKRLKEEEEVLQAKSLENFVKSVFDITKLKTISSVVYKLFKISLKIKGIEKDVFCCWDPKQETGKKAEFEKKINKKSLFFKYFNLYEETRQGLIAGRNHLDKVNNAEYLGERNVLNINEPMCVIDIVSSYPSVMLHDDNLGEHRYFPAGKIKCLNSASYSGNGVWDENFKSDDDEDGDNENFDYMRDIYENNKFIGFFDVRIDQSNLKHPILCGKDRFGNDWTQQSENIFYKANSIDINLCIKNKCKVEFLGSGFIFEKKIRNFELFSCLRTFEKLKINEDNLKREDKNHSDGLRNLSKLVLNSLSGKVVEKIYTTKYRFENNQVIGQNEKVIQDFGNELLIKQTNDLYLETKYDMCSEDYEFDDENYLIENETNFIDNEIENKNKYLVDEFRRCSPIQLASCIYAYARKNLYEMMEAVPNQDVVYCDTDSIFTYTRHLDIIKEENPHFFREDENGNKIFGSFDIEKQEKEEDQYFNVFMDKKQYLLADGDDHIEKAGFKGIDVRRDIYIDQNLEKQLLEQFKVKSLGEIKIDNHTKYFLELYMKKNHTMQKQEVQFCKDIIQKGEAYILSSHIVRSIEPNCLKQAFSLYQQFEIKKIKIEQEKKLLMNEMIQRKKLESQIKVVNIDAYIEELKKIDIKY